MKEGFSLFENLCALFISAMLIPTVIAGFTISLNSKSIMNQEERAYEIAQQIFADLPTRWNSSKSTLFPQSVPLVFPLLNVGQDSYDVLFTQEGGLFSRALNKQSENLDFLIHDPSLPQEGSVDVTGGFIVTIKRSSEAVQIPPSDFLNLFTVIIEHPAGQPRQNRKRMIYNHFFRKP